MLAKPDPFPMSGEKRLTDDCYEEPRRRLTIDDCLPVTVVAECNECSLIRALIYSDGTKRLEACLSLSLSLSLRLCGSQRIRYCVLSLISRDVGTVLLLLLPLTSPSFPFVRFTLLRFDYTNKQIFQFMTQKIFKIIPR